MTDLQKEARLHDILSEFHSAMAIVVYDNGQLLCTGRGCAEHIYIAIAHLIDNDPDFTDMVIRALKENNYTLINVKN